MIYIGIVCWLSNFIALSIAQGRDEWIDYFEFHTYIDEDDKFEVFWITNLNQSECDIEIGLAVETDGWVGFGLTESGTMEAADMIIGWVAENGQYNIDNRVGPIAGNGNPIIMEDQSGIEVVDGWKQDINGTIITYLQFKKDLFPDTDFGLHIKIGTTPVIYGWLDGELPISADIGYHGFGCGETGCRGLESMNLLQGESAENPLPEDICADDDNDTYEDESGFDWNEWYVYLGGAIIGLLLIVLIFYVICKIKNKNKKPLSVYERIFGSDKKEEKNYGTTTNKATEVSMHGRI